MSKPLKPSTHLPRETWWHEFKDAFHELCSDEVDEHWLNGLTATLHPFHVDRDPREAAAVAFATLNYEVPGYKLDEPFEPPPPRRRPGLH